MKPIIAMYQGHDVNVTVFDPRTQQFYIVEFERFTEEKHYRIVPKGPHIKHVSISQTIERNTNNMKRCLKLLESQFGIKNDYSTFILYRSCVPPTFKLAPLIDTSVVNCEELYLTECKHHEAHTWCAYYQSGFKNATVLSWDGGGDGTCFLLSEIQNGEIVEQHNELYQFSSLFNAVADITQFNTTSPLDVAGKMMGYSSYGEMCYESLDTLQRLAYTIVDQDEKELIERLMLMVDDVPVSGILQREIAATRIDYARKYLAQLRFDTEVNLIHTIQKFIEETIVVLLNGKYKDVLERTGGNLAVVGGTALNVLANENIKRKVDCNIYVPPNPHDGGLSVGFLYHFMKERKLLNLLPHKPNLAFTGLELQDTQHVDLIRGNDFVETEVTLANVSELLKHGKILGFLQGRSEVGPRALGNRSILCDPSIADMKDTLNHKVKFREWYRPFAPVCRKEDAHKYFESPTFDGMETMSYVADVKEEYRSVYPAITHVDNTARLQVVTKDFNPLFYDLLTEFDGVLLNTSFNIQGKPIMNTLNSAFWMLYNTGLDGFVWADGDKLRLYTLHDDMVFSK